MFHTHFFIYPRPIKTRLSLIWGTSSEEKETLGDVHLIKRMINPEEIADAVIFLLKNKAVCGEVLTVDGGMSLMTLG